MRMSYILSLHTGEGWEMNAFTELRSSWSWTGVRRARTLWMISRQTLCFASSLEAQISYAWYHVCSNYTVQQLFIFVIFFPIWWNRSQDNRKRLVINDMTLVWNSKTFNSEMKRLLSPVTTPAGDDGQHSPVGNHLNEAWGLKLHENFWDDISSAQHTL